jgi:cytosine/adenosine deaminase-related metal-dependent hydrolase
MTRIFTAHYLLPINATPIEGGALLVDDSRILAVDKCKNLTAAHPGATVVDFGETILLPPMVNAHTHLELSSFADWASAVGDPEIPQTFVDWILWLVRVRRSVTGDQFRHSLVDGLKASLLAGTGAVGDIFTTQTAISAYLDSPLRGRVFAEVLGHDPAVVGERLSAIQEFADNPPGPFLSWGLSPHAPYTLSSAAMDQAFASADSQSMPCSIHLAESLDETCFLHDGSGAIAEKLYAAARWDPAADLPPGQSPVSALCQPGRLKSQDLIVHGVQVDAADIDKIKAAGCSVALCPRSNAALRVGKAPVADYIKAGVPLALGTDSLASSSSLSIWDEMAFANQWFAGEAQPCDWLEMATHGGAKALGLDGRIGGLSPGYEASFQVVSLSDTPRLYELEEALCSSPQEVEVQHLYLAGHNALPTT